MSVNPWAGEVRLVIDGTPRRLKLTLGALAELEDSLALGSLLDLVERFEAGRFSARDLLMLLAAGLRGAGHEISAEALGQAEIEGGAVAAARAAGRLLALAFGPAAPGDGRV
ncbi:MAG: gene transfer agent family protein [Mangrovicoccus sp.]|nr:gene transfer agent family protein [Mangrovicoccus sp.]